MYLNLTGKINVRSRDIIGIFNIYNTATPEATKEFLRESEKSGAAVSDGSLPKSFVICDGDRVIFSPFSSKVLASRRALPD